MGSTFNISKVIRGSVLSQNAFSFIAIAPMPPKISFTSLPPIIHGSSPPPLPAPHPSTLASKSELVSVPIEIDDTLARAAVSGPSFSEIDDLLHLVDAPGRSPLTKIHQKSRSELFQQMEQDPFWHTKVFEDLAPSGRSTVRSLREWLLCKIEVNNKNHPTKNNHYVANQMSLYNVAFTDLSRQVSIHCVDRGRLMLEIWISNSKLHEWLIDSLASQKLQCEKKCNMLSTQISDLLGSLLKSKDLQEVIREKELRIVELESIARDFVSREEARDQILSALKSHHSHLESLYKASRDILTSLMPRSESYFKEAAIVALLEPLTDNAYMPSNNWEQLEQDVCRLISILFKSSNRHISKRLYTLVSSSMRDLGEKLPPSPMESILEGELAISKRNVSEALVEVNNLTLALSSARMTMESLQFENKDLKRRLERECHINALMDVRFREFEMRQRTSDASDPQRYESLRWIHSLVRNKEECSGGNVTDTSLTVIRKDLASVSRERAQKAVSQSTGKKDFLSTLRAARQRAAEDANLSAGLPDHLKIFFGSEFQQYDSFHFLFFKFSSGSLVDLSIQILFYKSKDDVLAFKQHREPKALMQIILCFFLESCGNPWCAEFLAWSFVLSTKSLIAEHRLIQAMSTFLGMYDVEVANDAYLAMYIFVFVEMLNGDAAGYGFVSKGSLWISSSFMQKKVDDWVDLLGLPMSLAGSIKSNILAESNNDNFSDQPKEYEDRKKMEFFTAVDIFNTHHVAFTECVNEKVKSMYANDILPMIASKNFIGLKELHSSIIKLNAEISWSDSSNFLLRLQRANQSLAPPEASFCNEIRKGWVAYYPPATVSPASKRHNQTSAFRLLSKELVEFISAYQIKLRNKRSQQEYAHLAADVDFTDVDLAFLAIGDAIRRDVALDDRAAAEQWRSLLSCLWEMRFLEKRLEPA